MKSAIHTVKRIFIFLLTSMTLFTLLIMLVVAKAQSDESTQELNQELKLNARQKVPVKESINESETPLLSQGQNQTEIKAEEDKTEVDSADQTETDKRDIEKIQVTGSRIKRIDMEGPSPVITIDREAMEQTGYNSVADVLRDMTVSPFGAQRERSGSRMPGVATVSLRGMGASRTLVLVDGRRIQKDPISNSADLNLIPFAAVERIEILKDSASAIYGSDALGGVVNIITRKNFNGSEASIKQFASEGVGGNQTELSVTSGYTNSKMNVTGVFYHRFNDAIYARDRTHSQRMMSPTGAPGSLRTLKGDGSPYKKPDGSIAERSKWKPDPSCPPDRIETLPGGMGQRCQYNFAERATTRPVIKQTSVMLNTNVKITGEMDTFVRLSGTRRNVKWVYAPTPAGSFAGLGASGKRAKTFLAKADSKLSKAFEGLQDDDFVDIHYRLMELGDRISAAVTSQYSLLTGVTREVGDTWEVEAVVGQNRSFRKDLGTGGYALEDELREHLSTQFNPFAPFGQRGDLSQLQYSSWDHSLSHLTFSEVSATGEVSEVDAGPIGMAVGIQVHREIFLVDADEATKAGKVIGSAGSELSGARSVTSSYLELSIPLTSNLEWNLAGRRDSYSDFGEAFSPKTSFRWQVHPQLMVRSSIGRGFKAPNMDALYAATSYGAPIFIDQVPCQENKNRESCLPQQWKVVSSGNRNLKEEESLSRSLGAVFQFGHQNSLGVDFWHLRLTNQVGIDFEDATMAESLFGPEYTKQFGINIIRDPVTNVITEMQTPILNLSELEIGGVDVSTELFANTGIGQWAFSVQHSHALFSKSVGFPGLPKRDRLGEVGLPQWRNVVSLAYAPTENQSGSITVRTIAVHEKELPEAGIHSRYTEVDLQYTYSGSWGGVISAGVRNVLGTNPPVDDSNPDLVRLDTSLYDGNGRIGWIQYKHSF